MVGRFDADFVVLAIYKVVGGAVSDGVLVAQLVSDVLERLISIIHVVRKKSPASGFLR